MSVRRCLSVHFWVNLSFKTSLRLTVTSSGSLQNQITKYLFISQRYHSCSFLLNLIFTQILCPSAPKSRILLQDDADDHILHQFKRRKPFDLWSSLDFGGFFSSYWKKNHILKVFCSLTNDSESGIFECSAKNTVIDLYCTLVSAYCYITCFLFILATVWPVFILYFYTDVRQQPSNQTNQ